MFFRSEFLTYVFFRRDFILLIKPRIFNILIDSSSLSIFSSSLIVNNKEIGNVLSQITVFKFFMHFTLSAIDFSHPNLFKIC